MKTLEVASKKWIAPGLPLGGVVLVGAREGMGKSPLAYHWLACVTAGKDFAHDIPVSIKPSKAMLFVGEGELTTEIHPGLIVAGVNTDNLEIFDCVKHHNIRLEHIPDIVRQHPDVRFVDCDTMTALAGKIPTTPAGWKKLVRRQVLCDRLKLL